MRARMLLTLSAILINFAPGRFPRGIDDLFVAALRLRQGHVVGHLDHQRCDALAEFLRQLLAGRCRIFDGVVQPAGRDEFGIGPIGRLESRFATSARWLT